MHKYHKLGDVIFNRNLRTKNQANQIITPFHTKAEKNIRNIKQGNLSSKKTAQSSKKTAHKKCNLILLKVKNSNSKPLQIKVEL